MSRRLAALRRSLDAMPSPVESRPGLLLRYEQWNVDPASVVSFAAVAFGRGEAALPGGGGA
jgi:hypothetical protein